MTSTIRTIAIAASLTLVAGATQAQDAGRFSLELNTGATLPTKELGSADLNPGMTLGMTANLLVMPHLAVYAGWNWARFTFDAPLGDYEDMDDTGYAFGARFFAPSLGPLTPWVRAGGVYDHVELEGEDSDVNVSGDHELGWEAGAGAAIALGERWSLLPGVRYRTFPSKLSELGGDADLSYVAIDLGLSVTFGGRSSAAIGHR